MASVLHPVPDADPRDAVKHLEMIRANAVGTFGEGSACVCEIDERLSAARREAKLREILATTEVCQCGGCQPGYLEGLRRAYSAGVTATLHI